MQQRAPGCEGQCHNQMSCSSSIRQHVAISKQSASSIPPGHMQQAARSNWQAVSIQHPTRSYAAGSKAVPELSPAAPCCQAASHQPPHRSAHRSEGYSSHCFDAKIIIINTKFISFDTKSTENGTKRYKTHLLHHQVLALIMREGLSKTAAKWSTSGAQVERNRGGWSTEESRGKLLTIRINRACLAATTSTITSPEGIPGRSSALPCVKAYQGQLQNCWKSNENR